MSRISYMLPAFATDFSAAISMISSMGGMSVLHAPSGCMGNYCGFDEPEWFGNPGLTYCSMLREDETIFGNDDILLGKIRNTCAKMSPSFVAVVGSPITALIGTDLDGIATLSEEETGIPTIAINTTGFDSYQVGLIKAFKSCVDKFSSDGSDEKRINLLGINKFDYHLTNDFGMPIDLLKRKGFKCIDVSCGCNLDLFKGIGGSEFNLAMSTAGLGMSKYLKKRYGTEYGPLVYDEGRTRAVNGTRALIIGDQVISNYIRQMIESEFGFECDVGTLFEFDASISESNDFKADTEREMFDRLNSEHYDCVISDPMIKRMIRYDTDFIPLAHPAVSSKIHWNEYVDPFKHLKGYLSSAMCGHP